MTQLDISRLFVSTHFMSRLAEHSGLFCLLPFYPLVDFGPYTTCHTNNHERDDDDYYFFPYGNSARHGEIKGGLTAKTNHI